MSTWQDATVNTSTGAISVGSGPDAVRVLSPKFGTTTAQVGYGVDIIMGGGSGPAGPAPEMQFNDAANSQLLAVLDDF